MHRWSEQRSCTENIRRRLWAQQATRHRGRGLLRRCRGVISGRARLLIILRTRQWMSALVSLQAPYIVGSESIWWTSQSELPRKHLRRSWTLGVIWCGLSAIPAMNATPKRTLSSTPPLPRPINSWAAPTPCAWYSRIHASWNSS